MVLELQAAEREHRPPPPLYKVGVTEAILWTKEMKRLAKSAHSEGIVNEVTASIRENLDRLINNESMLADEDVFDNAGGLGTALDIEQLNVQVDAAVAGPSFVPLTSREVDAATVGMEGGGDGGVVDDLELDPDLMRLYGDEPKKKPKKKRKKAAGPDPKLHQRMDRAAVAMAHLGLSRDTQKEGDKTILCVVCRKLWSTKRTVIGGALSHRKLVYTDPTREFRFCPFADDQSILKSYDNEKATKRSAQSAIRMRQHRAKKRSSDAMDVC